MKERGILFKGHLVKKIQEGIKTQTRRVCKDQDLDDIAPWSDIADSRTTVSCGNTEVERGGVMFLDGGDSNAWYGLLKTCPYGLIGDRLWVRETWCAHWSANPHTMPPGYREVVDAKVKQTNGKYAEATEGDPLFIYYKADWEDKKPMSHSKWVPSIHMFRWASRITLEITEVRVERIQDISEEDAQAEGIAPIYQPAFVAHGEVQGPDEVPAIDIFPDSWDKINEKRGFGWATNPWVWVITFRRVER